MMVHPRSILLLMLGLLVTACGSGAPPSVQSEQQNEAEREELLNAVERQLSDPSQASAPIDVPTTIPPPASNSGNMGHDHHDGMNDQVADSNQQDPQNGL